MKTETNLSDEAVLIELQSGVSFIRHVHGSEVKLTPATADALREALNRSHSVAAHRCAGKDPLSILTRSVSAHVEEELELLSLVLTHRALPRRIRAKIVAHMEKIR